MLLAHRREPDEVAEHDRDVALLRRARISLGPVQDAAHHGRRVIALQPLAPPRFFEELRREARLLDRDRRVVGERREHVEIGRA